MEIAPGSIVCVEITRTPRNAAACKTLTRICRKDPTVARLDEQRKRKRESVRQWRRGGRMWKHRMQSKSAVKLLPGARYTLRATVDVIRDLESVWRWVRVEPV